MELIRTDTGNNVLTASRLDLLDWAARCNSRVQFPQDLSTVEVRCEDHHINNDCTTFFTWPERAKETPVVAEKKLAPKPEPVATKPVFVPPVEPKPARHAAPKGIPHKPHKPHGRH